MSEPTKLLALAGLLVFSLVIVQASGAFTVGPIQRLARRVPPRIRKIVFVLDDLAKSRDEFAEARTHGADLALRLLGGFAGLSLAVGSLIAIASVLT
jgi:hypothetical protein